jgi:hypothetical protein
MDEEKKDETIATGAAGPDPVPRVAVLPTPPVAKPSEVQPHKGPGRPPKNKDGTAPAAAPTNEPPPRPRKPDAEIKDPRGAIDRAVQTLATCSRAYQVEHPESDLAWMWKKIREALPEEKGRIGAPIDESAFSPLVRGPVRGVEMIGSLPEEEKATPEEINEVAQSWARASTHLGLSERMAAIGSAVTKSVGLLGRQLTRTVVALMNEPLPSETIEKPIEGAAFPEAPPVDGEKKESER